MDETKFKEVVRKELRALDRKQLTYFVWRCALRALPFMGAKGHFDFWHEKSRQQHIYAVLYALDVNVAATNTSFYADAAYAADAAADADAADAAADAAYAAYDDADAAYAAYAADAYAAYAAYAAYDAYAAYTAYTAAYAVVADAYADAADVAAYAAAAAYTAAYAVASVAGNKNIDLKPLILQDLTAIKTQGSKLQPITTEWYGEIWNDFQKALAAEGCGYWGQLYKGIFRDGAVLDLDALTRRINVPKEIRTQGAAVVANYLLEMERAGAKRLNEARIIILGDKGAGKTCIARRLIDPDAQMTTDDESTAGVDTSFWLLEDEDINVRIWDFAGHTVTHAVHQFFLSERSLYLMVYDGRTENRNRLIYWLEHMKNYGGNSQAIILVNKRDQHPVDISENFLREHYPIAGIYTFSIQDDSKALLAFRNKVAGFIKNNPSWKKQEIPNSYYCVKDELETIFLKQKKESGREHISREEFDKIAQKYQIDAKETLLKSLHELGISLWYGDMDELDTLVLNPEWISHGVYKIINWVNEAKKHSLTLNDFSAVFSDDAERYPKEKHHFLFKLMKHYELAYETRRGKELVIPHLLKEDRPESLPDFPIGDSLMLRYKADQPLPPHTVSRFIVRHHEQIEQQNSHYLVWRYGVVLKDDTGSLALVREYKNIISVSVKGKNRTDYISRLRETLNDIFNSYKSDKPELQYRVERHGQIPDELEEKYPLWLPSDRIINHLDAGRSYFDDYTGQDIPLASTVNTYHIRAENFLMGGQGHHITKKIFNFHDCNIGLQGNLNELADLLVKGGHQEQAEELTAAAKALEQVENCDDKDEIKRKGAANRAKRLLEDLGDKGSKLHKSIEGIKGGVKIAQDLASTYNDAAQWLGFPQVPKPFLK